MQVRLPVFLAAAASFVVAVPAAALDPQDKPCAPNRVSRRSVAVSEPIMRSYVGDYAVSSRLQITVSLEDGLLRAHPTGEMERIMRALSETRFFIEGSKLELTFTKDAVGAVTGVVMHQGGKDLVGRKVR